MTSLPEPATPSRAAPEWSWGALRSSKLWGVATLLLGVGVWVQLFGAGAWTEIQLDQGRLHAVIAYLLPLFILGVGVWSRMSLLLLMILPVSLLPGLAMLPQAEHMVLSDGLSMIRVAASLGLYLAIASAGAELDRRHDEVVLLKDTGKAFNHQRFVLIRITLLLILLVVPSYGIFQDPDIAQALTQYYKDGPDAARAFLSLVHFFCWSVVAYMMVLLPALNIEYEQRSLGRLLIEQAKGLSKEAIARRTLLTLGACGLLFALGALLWS